MSAEAIFAKSRPYLSEVEERLHEAVSAYPGLVELVGAEAVDAGGKRMRPLLILLVSDDRERALRSSVAIELVH
nr:polyprenyl synthetase family protein [Actinomycetota bacterium]